MGKEFLHNRFSNFLIKYPPFSFLREEDIFEISKTARVQFFDKGEYIFRVGQTPEPYFYVLFQGTVELTYFESGEEVLFEVLESGDVFGLKALLGKRNYINNAKAREEVLVIQISYQTMLKFTETYPKLATYFSAGFSAGKSRVDIVKMELARQTLNKNLSPLSLSDRSTLKPDSTYLFKDREVVYCKGDISIKSAAEIMTKKGVGSILILDYEDRPAGIVTDVDFRKKVVREGIDPNKSISCIMSSPVYTVKKDITLAEALLLMLKRNIKHLCVTKDGTDQSEVEGIITERDLLLNQGNSPAILLKEINNSSSLKDIVDLQKYIDELLINYLDQDLSMGFIFEVITHLNDSVIQQIIYLSKIEMETDGWIEPEVKYAWVCLGSEGRKEQILRTDQDNAIIYEDPEPGKEEQTKRYFLELGRRVTKGLNDCGFSYCKGEIMASNPKWCASLSEWKNYFLSWIESPTPNRVMHFAIFFDLRTVYGEKKLVEILENSIHTWVKSNPNSLRFLALNAVASTPPLGLFKSLVVERSGEHKNTFDIKARGIVPIVDSARVLGLEEGIRAKSTIERWKILGERNTKNKEKFNELIIAFEILSKFRTKNYIKNPSNGNYLNPDSLGKIDKETMKNIFQVILELQKDIEVHFQLNLIPH